MSTAADWEFERVAGPYRFTEGPVWTGEALLFTDIPASRIMRYAPSSGACEVYATDTDEANGLGLDAAGLLYACEGGAGARRITRYEADGSRTTLADRYDGRQLNSPNDLVVDSQRRVWFTDPRYGDRTGVELDHDSVYRVSADGSSLTRVVADTTRPNGLMLSPDERTLYVAESPTAPHGIRQLRAYPVLDDGSLGPAAVLHDFGPHRGIDGMTVDDAGFVVASCGSVDSGPGPRIGVFAPDGAVVVAYPMPSDPTNCTFGDDDLSTLYVTAKDGALYRARTDRRGVRRSVPG